MKAEKRLRFSAHSGSSRASLLHSTSLFGTLDFIDPNPKGQDGKFLCPNNLPTHANVGTIFMTPTLTSECKFSCNFLQMLCKP